MCVLFYYHLVTLGNLSLWVFLIYFFSNFATYRDFFLKMRKLIIRGQIKLYISDVPGTVNWSEHLNSTLNK